MLNRPVVAVVAVVVALGLAMQPAHAGLDKKKAKYVGGTVTSIPANAEGKLNADDEKTLTFAAEKGAKWEIAYGAVAALSYGQHAGRRVGATVALGVTTLGIGALPLLFWELYT